MAWLKYWPSKITRYTVYTACTCVWCTVYTAMVEQNTENVWVVGSIHACMCVQYTACTCVWCTVRIALVRWSVVLHAANEDGSTEVVPSTEPPSVLKKVHTHTHTVCTPIYFVHNHKPSLNLLYSRMFSTR